MERITACEAFVEALASTSVTIPPPDGATEKTLARSIARVMAWPRRRRRLVVVPVAVLIVGGGVTALVLVPFSSPAHSNTRTDGTVTPSSVPLLPSPLPSATHPSPSPSPSASPSPPVTSTVPDTRTATSTSPPTTPAPSTSTRGPAGPSSDNNYLAGSQIAVPGCAGWMDDDGDLYGTVSAAAASCSAQDLRTNSDVMSPGTVSFQASNYSTASGSGPYFYFVGYQFTEQVCIWNQSDPSLKACTSKYTDKSGTVTKG